MKLNKALAITSLAICFIIFACKKDDTNSTPDYNTLIQGKWLWYKTITTSNQPNKYDTFYNQAMFKQFLENGTVITTQSNGQITNEKYFIVSNKLAQIYNNGADTAYSDITNFNSSAFSIYDKITYTNVNPPAVVEYWHYFVK